MMKSLQSLFTPSDSLGVGDLVQARRQISPSPLSDDPPIKRWTAGVIVDLIQCDGLYAVEFDGQIELCEPDDLCGPK